MISARSATNFQNKQCNILILLNQYHSYRTMWCINLENISFFLSNPAHHVSYQRGHQKSGWFSEGGESKEKRSIIGDMAQYCSGYRTSEKVFLLMMVTYIHSAGLTKHGNKSIKTHLVCTIHIMEVDVRHSMNCADLQPFRLVLPLSIRSIRTRRTTSETTQHQRSIRFLVSSPILHIVRTVHMIFFQIVYSGMHVPV